MAEIIILKLLNHYLFTLISPYFVFVLDVLEVICFGVCIYSYILFIRIVHFIMVNMQVVSQPIRKFCSTAKLGGDMRLCAVT